MLKKVFIAAHGNVQDVMFRQTILRVAEKFGLTAGATNCYYDPDRVDISIEGKEDSVNKFFEKIKPGNELNSWGAKIDKLEFLPEGREPLDHQINTNNFNQIHWRNDIKFYV